jgi:hypothetical protein
MNYHEIVSKILRPQQPQREAALLTVFEDSHQPSTLRRIKERHPVKARELWERLVARELIPESWLNDESRCFGALNQSESAVSSIPTDEMTALCVAADPIGIETSERLAFEVLSRLGEWYDVPTPKKVLWLFGDHNFWDWSTALTENRGHLFEEFQVLVPASLAERSQVERAIRSFGDTNTAFKRALISGWESTFSVAARDISYAYLWQAQAEKRVPQQDTYLKRLFPEAVRGKLFRELRSPFAALADLWAQGYVFADFGEEFVTLFGRSLSRI